MTHEHEHTHGDEHSHGAVHGLTLPDGSHEHGATVHTHAHGHGPGQTHGAEHEVPVEHLHWESGHATTDPHTHDNQPAAHHHEAPADPHTHDNQHEV